MEEEDSKQYNMEEEDSKYLKGKIASVHIPPLEQPKPLRVAVDPELVALTSNRGGG